MKAILTGILIAILLSAGATGADYIDLTQQGNKAYIHDSLDVALDSYKEAQVEKPGDALLDYNIGSVLHKQAKYEEAIERYRKALYTDEPEFQADAYYNMGNTFFRSEHYPEAIAAYQKALELRPEDVDAKYNLELSRKRLKEQAQQQQSNDQQQQQQDQQEQQDQQDQQQQDQQQQQQQSEQDQQQGDQQNQDQQQQDDQQNQQDQQQQQQQEEQQEQQGQQGEQGEEQQDQQQQQGQQAQPEEQEGMSKEDAQRILNAIAGDEKDLQKQIRRLKVKSNYRGKDW